MQHTDILTHALAYALDTDTAANPSVTSNVAVVNASGHEPRGYVKQSIHACNKLPDTLNGVFNTVLVRATRQTAETLGLVAQAMRHAAPKGHIYIAQENAHGAASLEKQLHAAFTGVRTIIKHKCRVMVLQPDAAKPDTIKQWAAAAALQLVPATGCWSAPGLFAWDRFDAGSKLLLAHLPGKLDGRGADFGCGYGYLSREVIGKEGVKALYAIDADARAVEACRKNLEALGTEKPFQVFWRDATMPQAEIPKLDWIVMNPPFHTQQEEDRELGQKFCQAALKLLRTGGKLYLVANRHMPYEALLEKAARKVTLLADKDGFKILCAQSA